MLALYKEVSGIYRQCSIIVFANTETTQGKVCIEVHDCGHIVWCDEEQIVEYDETLIDCKWRDN